MEPTTKGCDLKCGYREGKKEEGLGLHMLFPERVKDIDEGSRMAMFWNGL